MPLQSLHDFPSRDFEFGFFPVDGFLKRQFRLYWRSLPRSARLPPPPRPAEKIFKDIVKDVAKSAPAEFEAVKARPPCLGSGMAEHVVAFAFVLIAQDLIGFIDFFELFFRVFFCSSPALQVGMMLAGQLPKGFFELVVGRVAFDA